MVLSIFATNLKPSYQGRPSSEQGVKDPAILDSSRRRAVGLWSDVVAAFEDGAGADGQGGGGDIAFDFGFGADEDGAAADDLALHFSAHDQPAAVDLVGDHVAFFLDGDDAAGLDDPPGFVLLEALVFELEGLVAE